MSDTPGWHITEDSFSSPESLFALSNGYFGIRGAAEEYASTESRGAYVNGFFERSPIRYGEDAYGFPRWHETIVSVPRAGIARFRLDGAELGRDGRSAGSTRRLDLRRGVLERTLAWRLPDGRTIDVASERFVSLARQNVAAFRIRYRVGAPGRAELSSMLETQPANSAHGDDPRVGAKFSGAPFSRVRSDNSGPVASLVIRTLQSELSLACAVRSEAYHARMADGADGGGIIATALPVAGYSEGNSLRSDFAANLAEGDELSLVLFVSYRRDPACGSAARKRRETDPSELAARLETQAKDDVARASAMGFDALLAEHSRVLERFWESAGLELDGPPGLAEAIRFNMFHVFQAAGRDGATNVPAKGLTGEGYEGHYFWDTEIYLLPMLSYVAPEIARALVEYRASILDAARERAKEMGHGSGALFPWRTISGAETSAYFPAGTAQYHIDADVAYAAMRYARAAGDSEFLYGRALDILVETARLWLDLGHYGRDGKFRLDGVTGPDEYSAIVNNNAYTNIMARENLRAAASLAEAARRGWAEGFDDSANGLGLADEEISSWIRAADSMFVPGDDRTGVIPQDDSFMDREAWDLAGTPASKFPLLLHYHPLTIYRKRILKQPDLLLAMMLRSSEFSLAEKKRNFAFYEPLTTGDSSLSHCVMSVMAAETGGTDAAWRYFMRTVRMDLDDLHGNAAHGVHIAAMGGSWLSLVFGFAGFRDDGGEYRFSPRLPNSLGHLAFGLHLSYGRLSVRISQKEASYAWAGSAPLEFSHEGKKVMLEPGASTSFDLTPRLRAVIFDLDGVIADTAKLHYRAWKRVADEIGAPFDEAKNETLKGRSRMESLELLLGEKSATFSAAEKASIAERKNAYYASLVTSLRPDDALPGARELIGELRSAGIKVGLASASRNAPAVLARLGLGDAFDAIADPSAARPKPDPELFLAAAEAMGVRRFDCVGVEDAQAGIDAIRGADMRSVAIGLTLAGADNTLASTADLSMAKLKAAFAG